MKTPKEFAREIAHAYQGRLKRDEFEVPGTARSEVRVDGTHRGRQLRIYVFPDGCLVEGSTKRRMPATVALNCAFPPFDNPVTDALPAGALPVFRGHSYRGGEEFTPEELPALRNELRALWEDHRNREALLALQLTSREFLLLTEQPLFGNGPSAFYFLHRSSDLEHLARRLDTLFELLPDVPAGAIDAKRITDTAYGIKVGRGASQPTATQRHHFGGTLADGPKCPNCATPIHLILTIDTHDPKVRLRKIGRRHFPVLFCLNCMSWGTLYVDYGGKALRVLQQDKADKVNADDAIEERAVSLAPLASPNTSSAKVGGSPKWLQGPAVPVCVRCDKPMGFLAQLKSLPTLAFGDDGTLYSFVCLKCKVSASLIQSH